MESDSDSDALSSGPPSAAQAASSPYCAIPALNGSSAKRPCTTAAVQSRAAAPAVVRPAEPRPAATPQTPTQKGAKPPTKAHSSTASGSKAVARLAAVPHGDDDSVEDDSNGSDVSSESEQSDTTSDSEQSSASGTRKRTRQPATSAAARNSVSPLTVPSTLAPHENDALRSMAVQMLAVWQALLPELEGVARRVDQQAQDAMRTSASINRLIGTHTGLITQIAKSLEQTTSPAAPPTRNNA